MTRARDKAALAPSPIGRQTIWVPASAMSPSVSNGCAALATTEIHSSKPNILTLDFDTSTAEYAEFSVAFPKSWNKDDVTFQLYWSANSTSSAGVAFMMQSLALNDTTNISLTGYGVQGALTDTHSASATKVNITSESSALSIGTSSGPTPSDSALVYFKIQRQTYSSSDTLASDVRVHGLKLFYTTDAVNDE